MRPKQNRSRDRIDAFFCRELNACADELEQAEFCDEAVKMALAAYTIRYRNAPPRAKAAALIQLSAITTEALDKYTEAFFPDGQTEGLRQ